MNKGLIASLLLLSLSGCMRTVWVKPNATQGDFEQIKATCMLEAVDRVPQDNRMALVAEGRSMFYQKCRDKHHCYETTEYVPPQYGLIDHNRDLRDQVTRACLYRNGWQEVELKDGE